MGKRGNRKSAGRFQEAGGDVKMGVASGRATKPSRWKKSANQQQSSAPNFNETYSGDALDYSGQMADYDVNDAFKAELKEKKASKKRMRKQRFKASKVHKRELHDKFRQQMDKQVRMAPHDFLWERYTAWAKDRITSVEKAAEKWTSEQVHVVEDGSNASLIPYVKRIVGDDYAMRGNWKAGRTPPGCPCIALGHGALQAVGFATRIYDGTPVAKLFSKHIQIDVQRDWLRRSAKGGRLSNATGTPKRIERLLEDKALTLEYTSALIIDMSRDSRLFNILDIPNVRDELLEFMHKFVRPPMAAGQLKVILVIPKVEEMPTERIMVPNPKKSAADKMEE